MVDLLDTTVLALGLSYIGFDLYFFAATFAWSRRLRHVNRDALLFSGFRDVLNFVFQGPVPGVVQNLTEPATTTERAGRVVTEAYPQLRDELGGTHQRFELPQRLLQLQKEARTIRWLSAAFAVGLALLVVFNTLTPYGLAVPYGFEVLIVVVLGNSVLTILFATTRAETGISLRESEEVLDRARAVRSGRTVPVTSPTPERR